MSKEALSRVGFKMPTPRFLDIESPFENEAKPIGIIVSSPLTGKKKTFVWWDNERCDLNSAADRSELAQLLTRLTISKGVEFAIGPAINPKGSHERSGKIKILSPKHPRVGIYVEPSGRKMLSWRIIVGGIPREETIRVNLAREGRPNDFNLTLTKITSSLPRPVNLTRE